METVGKTNIVSDVKPFKAETDGMVRAITSLWSKSTSLTHNLSNCSFSHLNSTRHWWSNGVWQLDARRFVPSQLKLSSMAIRLAAIGSQIAMTHAIANHTAVSTTAEPSPEGESLTTIAAFLGAVGALLLIIGGGVAWCYSGPIRDCCGGNSGGNDDDSPVSPNGDTGGVHAHGSGGPVIVGDNNIVHLSSGNGGLDSVKDDAPAAQPASKPKKSRRKVKRVSRPSNSQSPQPADQLPANSHGAGHTQLVADDNMSAEETSDNLNYSSEPPRLTPKEIETGIQKENRKALYAKGKQLYDNLGSNEATRQEGLELIQRAANLKYRRAECKMGEIARSRQEYDEAISWLKRAHSQQLRAATLSLGEIYLLELQDNESSNYVQRGIDDYLLPLAEKDDIKAQYRLGRYYTGIKDYEKAKHWFGEILSDKKHRHSSLELYRESEFEYGWCFYVNLQVIAIDDPSNPDWIRMYNHVYEAMGGIAGIDKAKVDDALPKWKVLACYVLGDCYENGYGTEADIGEATSLYQISANHGDSYAIKALEKLATEKQSQD